MPARYALILAALVSEIFSSGAAQASTTYPEEIAKQLELQRPPECTLCHLDNEGGLNTARMPFATSMQRLGATGGSNLRTLDAALARAESNATDSDGDGTPDVEELREGADPNVGLSGEPPISQLPLPRTGCSTSSGPERRDGPWLAGLLLCFGWLLRRRY